MPFVIKSKRAPMHPRKINLNLRKKFLLSMFMWRENNTFEKKIRSWAIQTLKSFWNAFCDM